MSETTRCRCGLPVAVIGGKPVCPGPGCLTEPGSCTCDRVPGADDVAGPVAAALGLGQTTVPDDDAEHLRGGEHLHGDGDQHHGDGDRDPGGEPAPSFTRYDLGALLATGVPPPALLCGGLLYAGGLHTLTGPPDCGKTTLALWCALQLLAEGRAVAMFDEEAGPELTAEKLLSLGAGPADITGLHYFPYPARTWTPGDVAELARTLTGLRPALVIWDSSAAFLARAGLDENDALDVTRFWSSVLAPCARRVGAAVLVADHDPKNPNGSRYSRGSGAKLAVADVAFKIRLIRPFSRTQDGLLGLDITKDRRGWLARAHRIHVGHNPLALAITEAAEDQPAQPDLTPAQEKLLDVIDDTPRTARELTDRFAAKHGHGLRRETVSRALNGLADDGLVDQLDTGKGKPHLWSLNPQNPRSDL